MRKPSTKEALYAWHALAISGEPVGRHDEQIECGFFKCRLVRGGPFVPASITCQQEIDPETGELVDDERFVCEVNGVPSDASEQWPHLCGNPIAEAEYNYLVALRQYSAWHEPDAPAANPRKPVDWRKLRPPDFGSE